MEGVSFPPPPSAAPTRCLPMAPLGVGTSLQESLPSYINRLADAHEMSVVTFLSNEVMPGLDLATNTPPSNYLGTGSRFLFLGERLAVKVAKRLASLTGVPEVTALVHHHLSGSLGWTRDFRDYSAWCPECFAEWDDAGEPLYFPLLWAFREVHCCSRHDVPLVEECPYCNQRFRFLTGQVWDGTCDRCERKLAEVRGSGRPTQWAVDFTRLVEGLVGWSAALTEPNDFVSMLVDNIKRASVSVGGGKPLSACWGSVLAPWVFGFPVGRRVC